MSSREPGRPEYERRASSWLGRRLPGERPRIFYPGEGIRVEGVQLEGPGEGSSVVITFWGPDRAGRLSDRGEDAVRPPHPGRDPYRDAPKGWAGIVAIDLQEGARAFGSGMPNKCGPKRDNVDARGLIVTIGQGANGAV